MPHVVLEILKFEFSAPKLGTEYCQVADWGSVCLNPDGWLVRLGVALPFSCKSVDMKKKLLHAGVALLSV